MESIAAQLAKTALGSPATYEIVSGLVKSVSDARDEYAESQAKETDALQDRREGLIRRLNTVQNTILFNAEPAVVGRLMPFALEQVAEIYRSRSDAELTTIDLNVSQIETIVGRHEHTQQVRRRARDRAAIVTLILVGAVVLLTVLSPEIGLGVDTVVPILGIPFPVVLWSVIGSLAAMLYRYTRGDDGGIADPWRWLFTRPLLGAVMGIISYLIVKVGLVSVGAGATTANIGSREFIWLMAFLVGFSDRFAEAILRATMGRFDVGGAGELMPLAEPHAAGGPTSVSNLLSILPWFTPAEEQADGKAAETEAENAPAEDASPTAVVPRSPVATAIPPEASAEDSNGEGER